MLARSSEPEAHDRVLNNNPDRIGIWKCWFLRRGENWSTRRKTSRSKEENQQQTQSTCDAGSGNGTRDTLVEGERSHHCAIPAPQFIWCSHFLGRQKWVCNKRSKFIGNCVSVSLILYGISRDHILKIWCLEHADISRKSVLFLVPVNCSAGFHMHPI